MNVQIFPTFAHIHVHANAQAINSSHWFKAPCLLAIVYFYAWIKTQGQTNGNTITVDGQKSILDNSVDKNQIALYANDIKSTDHNQP